MKKVSQLDADGFFVVEVDAIESPLEPGVFLLPGGCVDATAPEISDGFRAKWVGGGFVLEEIVQPDPDPEPTLEDRKAQAIRSVDGDADAIYGAVLGNRGPEYERAERDALAFQEAGFTGTTPPYVATWASASGMSPQAAAEDILAEAAAWNNAAIAIRQNRLSSKAAVRVAADAQEISAAMAGWSAFVAAIKTQLGA